MPIKKKYVKVDQATKDMIMSEYLLGELTQKELGLKYGFSHRRLSHWFKSSDRLDEYNEVNKNNRYKSNSEPMTDLARLKITGFNNIYWEGKKLDVKNGEIRAILLPAPDHPHANSQGYVYEHRLVLEKHLNRYLRSDELVHHIDLDPTNNEIENLLIVNVSEHGKLHLFLQLALVKLMPQSELRELTHFLLQQIKETPYWTLGRNKKDKKRAHKL